MNKISAMTLTIVCGLALPPAAVAQTSRNVDGTITRVDEPGARMTIRHGPRKGQLTTNVGDKVKDRMLLLGRERGLL